MTIEELKELLKDWPNECANGEPAQVWISTRPGCISPCDFKRANDNLSGDMLLLGSE